MTLYPDGYETAMISLDAMRNKHGAKMHPEYARRFFAYIEYKGGLLGVGGGWRATQPVKPGFAPPGKSFHESQTFASGQSKYAAVDLVCPVPGKKHRAPSWAECEDAPLYGLHTFIDGEPWHIQCIEMRGYDSWVKAGRPDPPLFPLPGSKPDPLPPTSKDDDMLGLDFGVAGSDSWWTRLTYTGDTLTHVKSPADQLQARGGVKVVAISETELNALLDSIMTIGDSPFHAGGQAPNSALDTKWNQARGRT